MSDVAERAQAAFEAYVKSLDNWPYVSRKEIFLAGHRSRDAEVVALQAAQKPTPCSERRPEYGVPVACFHPGFRAGEGWTVQRPEEDESFTHWLPLPDPIPTESDQ